MKDWIGLILSVISFLVALELVLNHNADKKKINHLTGEVERLELECEMLRMKNNTTCKNNGI